jgi:hypothetical protein
MQFIIGRTNSYTKEIPKTKQSWLRGYLMNLEFLPKENEAAHRMVE